MHRKNRGKGLSNNLRVICNQYGEFLAIVGILDQNYHYKSQATQIPHNSGLTLTILEGIEPMFAACLCATEMYRTSISPIIASLNIFNEPENLQTLESESSLSQSYWRKFSPWNSLMLEFSPTEFLRSLQNSYTNIFNHNVRVDYWNYNILIS